MVDRDELSLELARAATANITGAGQLTARIQVAILAGMQHVAPESNGWAVMSGDRLRYRCWEDGFPAWTEDRTKATLFARRQDAEAVHQEDEDAWYVCPLDQPEVSLNPKDDPRYPALLKDALARVRGENLDGTPRRQAQPKKDER